MTRGIPSDRSRQGGELTPEERITLLAQIEEAPAKLREAVAGLDDAQLDTPYREEGWTVRQVVHHVVDSHINAYMRLRWALTEDGPTVLEALHVRWMVLWRALKESDFSRTWKGPDYGYLPVDDLVRLYAWHGKHHVAHITSLRERVGW